MAYLAHYGIKGQKWGIRNGPPYPLGNGKRANVNYQMIKSDNIEKHDTTLPKGFRFNRVGHEFLDFNKSGGLYVSAGEQDANRYIRSLGPSLLGKLLNTYSTHSQSISVTKPIKMSSQENTRKIISEVLLKNDDIRKKFDDSIWVGAFIDGSELTTDILRKAVNEPGSKEAKQVSYSIMKCFGEPEYSKQTESIYKEFRRKGYDAIPDLHDRTSGLSETATIILNKDKIQMKESTYITKDMMKNARQMCKQYGSLKVDEAIS